MKLFLISQEQNGGYDVYDSAVVAAESEEAARMIQPGGADRKWGEKYSDWCKDPSDVTVEYIGEAATSTPAGVICASFNAG